MALKRKIENKSKNPIINKTPNLENEPKTTPVKQVWVEDYLSLRDFEYHPATDSFFKRIALELMDWADQDGNLVLNEFFSSKRIPYETFKNWFSRYQVMGHAHRYAKIKIGARREIGAILKKYDGNFIRDSMMMYDPEWRELMEFKRNMDKESQERQKVEIVFPDITKAVK